MSTLLPDSSLIEPFPRRYFPALLPALCAALLLVSCGGGGGGDSGGAGAGAGAGSNPDFYYIGGTVYHCQPNVAPGSGTPTVAGAKISSSLDSVTTTSDGSGNFFLLTTQSSKTHVAWTLTITATGYPTNVSDQDGAHITGGHFCLMPYTGPTVTVAPSSLPLAQVGTAYPSAASPNGVQLLTQGGLQPFTWSLAGGTSLPAGMSLSSTGLIQGTPSTAGRSVFTAQVTDNAQAIATATMSVVVQPASVTTNNGALSGSYAFLLRGFDDATGSPFAVLGSITADGNGAITGGIEDIVAPTVAATAGSVPVTGSYSIDASDNRGTLTLTGNSVTRLFSIALGQFSGAVAANADGIQIDDTNGTSGQRGNIQLEQQTPSDFLASRISGGYAFALGGVSGNGSGANRQVLGGTVNADGIGTWNGVGDFNRVGVGAVTDNVLSGTFGTPDTIYGRASAEITYTGQVATGTYTGVIYMVSANRLLFTSTGNTQSGVLSGRLQQQNFGTAVVDNALVNGTVVTYLTGSGVQAPATTTSVVVSISSADGKGGLTDHIADHNSSGSVTAPCTGVTTTSTYAVDSNAHVTVPAGTNNGYRAYLYSATDGFLISLGSVPAIGFVRAQQATALNRSTRFRASQAPGASRYSVFSAGVAATTASLTASAVSLTTSSITAAGVQQTGTTAINLTPAQATGCYVDNVGTRAVYVVSPTRFLLLDLSGGVFDTSPVIRDFQP